MIEKDLERNALVVGFKNSLGRKEFFTHSMNWISGTPPTEPFSAEIRIRYKSRSVPGMVELLSEHQARIILEEPLPDITPGQAGVLYQDQVCLGGGTISLEES